MKTQTKTEHTARIRRKLEQAIDRLVDVQDLGGGCDTVSRCLEMLNCHLHSLEPS